MRSTKLALLYGFLVWLIPFVISFLVFPFHDSNRALFESVMAVAVTMSVVLFSVLYFKKADKNFTKEGIMLGVIWYVINIGIDLLMFMWGPMKMTFVDYMADIGLTYLIIPTVTIGIGKLLCKMKVEKSA